MKNKLLVSILSIIISLIVLSLISFSLKFNIDEVLLFIMGGILGIIITALISEIFK